MIPLRYFITLILMLSACEECPVPETWQGARLVSEFGWDWTQCGVYESGSCSYTVCQEGQLSCDWELDSYYCW